MESESFIGIDRTVKEIFDKAVAIKNILDFSTSDGLLEKLE